MFVRAGLFLGQSCTGTRHTDRRELVVSGLYCWNLVHVAHLVNSKACTIIVLYCQDKERLLFLNMGVSYHSKIDACERKGDC
jgi:hypothetical protein